MSAGTGTSLEFAYTTTWGGTVEVRFTDGSSVEMTQAQYVALNISCCEQCGVGCSRESR